MKIPMPIGVVLLMLILGATSPVAAQDSTTPNNDSTSNSSIYLPLVVNSGDAEGTTKPSALLADGQFVDGPNVGSFDVETYLAEQQSPFQPFASIISDKASYYSVNPRVVLTILELLYPASIGHSDATAIAEPVGASGTFPDREEFAEQVERLLLQLTEHFYGHLYGRNLAAEDADAYQKPTTIQLRNGESINWKESQGAASDAIELTLAEQLSAQRWKQLAAADRQESFVATWHRLFPESDPIDTSNQIRPPAAPPGDLAQAAAATMPVLKLPFAAGDSWRFTGGPHAYDGCSDHAFSAVDFAPVGYSGCSDPVAEDRWITAPADATISRVSCGGCNVALNHSNGWGTRFYHVANPQVSVGENVSTDQLIGNPSCAPVGIACGACSGSSTGVHQHIDLLYNGAFVPIEGAKFEEYTVHGEACYQGYLEKNGSKYYPPARITSRPDSVPPTATIAISGNLGQNRWYQLPLEIILGGEDDRLAIGRIRYQLQHSDLLSQTDWIEETDSSLTLSIAEDGQYIISAKVSDLAGNWSVTRTLAFQVDGRAPTLPVVIERACNTVSGQWTNECDRPAFEWSNASDAYSGVAGYEVFWQSPALSETTAIYTTTPAFVPDAVGEGEFSLSLRTIDRAGNWSDWYEAFVFGYDHTPPVGTLVVNHGELIARTAIISVTTTMSDNGKIGEMRLRNNVGEWGEWQPFQPASSWQLRGENGQAIIISAQLRDAAGNLSEVVSDTVMLNTQVAKAESTRYQLVRSTLGASTAKSASSRFALKGIAGQSSLIGAPQSSQFRLSAGYLRLELPADLAPAPTRTPPPITIEPELVCQLSIEYGALYTSNSVVTLQLDVTAAESMSISASPVMNERSMVPYTPTVSIDLPASADQISTLAAYGFFGGKDELLCNGEVLSDTIVYDPLPPIIEVEMVTFGAENENREGNQPAPDTLRIVASDQAEGSGVAELQLSSQADFSGADWQPFSELIPLPLDDWHTLYVRARDNAGNISTAVKIVNQSLRSVYLPLVAR